MAQLDLHSPGFAGIFGAQSRPAAIWPVAPQTQPQRHASRPKVTYRARGSHPAKPATDDRTGTVWIDRTSEIARNKRRTQLLFATCLPVFGVSIALAGFAIYHSPATPAPLTVTAAAPTLAPAPPITAIPPALSARRSTAPATTRPALPDSADRPPRAPAALAPVPVSLAPALAAAPAASLPPVITLASAASPAIIAQRQPAPPPQPAAPACSDCTPAPQLGGVTLAVHTSDAAPVAGFSDLGAKAVVFTRSRITPGINQVRYYRAQDEKQARLLAARHDAAVVDLTWFAPGDDSAIIDFFMAAVPQD